ncbi:MAG TPA: 50S ribosomal protein L3 [Candidatus Krumholzibacteria bacterium]|nr:50S ribosomal protein L3 [Candidatus Krumholzibacteria bacterium]
MKALLGRKLGMTQIFDQESGEVWPVTVLQLGPCPVVQVKRTAKEGYEAVQIGFGAIRTTLVDLPSRGHFRKAGVEPRRHLREFRVDDASGYEVGQELTVEMFQGVAKVDVVGTSKGRGFQGGAKRHGFHRGPRTHGSRNYRAPGSIGQHSNPGRVFLGLRMPGRMGNARVTLRNLSVRGVDTENNLLLVGGAVPGAPNAVVLVRVTEAASAGGAP